MAASLLKLAYRHLIVGIVSKQSIEELSPDEERYYFYRLYSIEFDITQHTLSVPKR